MTGWRTVVFNIVTLLVAVLNNAADVPFIPPWVVEYGLIGGNLLLRFLTTTPVGVAPK